MKQIVLLLLVVGCFSCKKAEEFVPRKITSVAVEPLMQDTLLSIRAIELLNDKSLSFAADHGAYGLYDQGKDLWQTSVQKFDSLEVHFRAIGHTATDFFMLSIGNPALLYKTGNGGKMELVYKETDDKVFYDAMDFWNDKEGIAVGDPTGDCMSVIITRDGGETWTKLSCDNLPKTKLGEVAFAASDSNIAIVDDHTWVVTGGKVSRILYSSDKGKTWKVYETPALHGKETTGLYSIDFYDAFNGFAIGGDYTMPEQHEMNKIRTRDGGKTWEAVAKNDKPGYRSCVQYMPNRNGKELVAIGFNGIDYSKDSGSTWEHLSDESFYTLRFLNDSVAYAAGKGRISRLTFKE